MRPSHHASLRRAHLATLACAALAAWALFFGRSSGEPCTHASAGAAAFSPPAVPQPAAPARTTPSAPTQSAFHKSSHMSLAWAGPADASLPPARRLVCDASLKMRAPPTLTVDAAAAQKKTQSGPAPPTPPRLSVDAVLAHLVKQAKAQGRTPVTVLDVGANVGQTATALAAAGADRVVSFEPHPRTCAAFLAGAARLPGNATRFDLVCSAVGAAPGLTEFVEVQESTSFMQRPAGGATPKAATGRTMVVPVVTLADVAAQLSLAPGDVAVLKTDTQGREAGVLVGYGPARLTATPHVVLEFSYGLLRAAGTHHPALLAFLADAGFECAYLAKHVIGGTVPWPHEVKEGAPGGCVGFDAFTAAVKGGWTNLWCENVRMMQQGGGGSGGSGGGGSGGRKVGAGAGGGRQPQQ